MFLSSEETSIPKMTRKYGYVPSCHCSFDGRTQEWGEPKHFYILAENGEFWTCSPSDIERIQQLVGELEYIGEIHEWTRESVVYAQGCLLRWRFNNWATGRKIQPGESGFGQSLDCEDYEFSSKPKTSEEILAMFE